MDWPGIFLDARVIDLAGRHVAVRGIGPDGKPTMVLATVGRARRGELSARVCTPQRVNQCPSRSESPARDL